MKFVDQLRAARNRSGPVLHQFLLEYKPDGKTIHTFFEGYDDESFYTNFLDSMLPAGYTLRAHRCGKKSEVYEAFRKIDHRVTRKGRALFFVDKDLSDYLGETWPVASNIFVTCHYSIENYLVTPTVIRRALRELYQMTDSEESVELVLARFQAILDRFYSLMAPIMLWILAMRHLKVEINLNNLQMQRLFDVTADSVKRKPAGGNTYTAILEAELSVTSPRGTASHISRFRKQIAGHSPKAYVRGKYEAWLLVAYLTILSTEASLKTHITLHKASFIQLLGPRLSMPDDVRQFLTANFATLL
ncbi:MAG: DUF4435 domain-containing protein [Isosphaeraceae bacterium]